MLVALLVATPALLLPMTAADTSQFVIVLAFIAGFMIFIEYYGRAPSFVEFRYAPPYNRLRFFGFAVTIILLTLILRGKTDPTTLTALATRLGTNLGRLCDFPYSPVRLVLLMLPADATATAVANLRIAAGLAYVMSLLTVLGLMMQIWLFGWPTRRRAFNVWLNLPLFDPTGGGDVLQRLKRDASLNVVLGVLLPFLLPAMVKAASDLIDPVSITDQQTMIWTISIWAFLPASLIMRGLALSRIARMVAEKRRRAYARAEANGLQRA